MEKVTWSGTSEDLALEYINHLKQHIEHLKKHNGEYDDRLDEFISMIEDDNKCPLMRFIHNDMQSNIPNLILTYPGSGLLQLLTLDVNHPLIEQISNDVTKKSEIINVNDELKKYVLEEQHREMGKIDEYGKIAFTLLDARIVIHEDEYLEHFHILFSDASLGEDEIANLKRVWVSTTKSHTAKVEIVNSEGERLFTHPGLMADLDLRTQYNKWSNYALYSKINRDIKPGFDEKYQRDYNKKFGEVLELTKAKYNKESIAELVRITKYFNGRLNGATPSHVNHVEEPVQKVDPLEVKADWDIFNN